MEIKDLIFELDGDEMVWWKNSVKEFRSNIVKEPKYYTKQILKKRGISSELLAQNIDIYIKEIREEVWNLYLIDEAKFHKQIIYHLIQNRDIPKKILEKLVSSKFLEQENTSLNKEAIFNKIADIVGEYTGRVMPYIYYLSLSTTNSRRSRSGKTFEKIIEACMDVYNYPYQNQSSLGKEFFNKNKLGKKVDLIVPEASAYENDRSKCAVVTAKTSLRERWQEVAEELQRTNVPHIYLLTADESVTSNVVDIIANYNITLIVYESEKIKKFAQKSKVYSFSNFFNKEIPHIINYWRDEEKKR